MKLESILNTKYLLVAGIALLAHIGKVWLYAISGGSGIINSLAAPLILFTGAYLLVYKKIIPSFITTGSFLILGPLVGFVMHSMGLMTSLPDIFYKPLVELSIRNAASVATIPINLFTFILPLIAGYLSGLIGGLTLNATKQWKRW